MERVAIILRKAHAINRFREIILRSFQEPKLNNILICSGFFQDRANYQASACFVASAPHLPCTKNLISVGLYNAIWRKDYDAFTKGLRSIKCACGKPMNLEKRRVSKYHWHAKVFIASEDDRPLLGIIGSSNITNRAFGPSKQWNYEVDVVLWNSQDTIVNAIVSGALGGLDDDNPFGVVVSDYAADDSLNSGLSLEARLIALREEIINVSDIAE